MFTCVINYFYSVSQVFMHVFLLFFFMFSFLCFMFFYVLYVCIADNILISLILMHQILNSQSVMVTIVIVRLKNVQ